MKIEKYKKTTKGRYKIYLDDGRELLLYEDAILKFGLLLKKEILEKDIMEVELFNQECDVYQVGLESINHRFKSIYDLKETLLKKEYPFELVEKAIEKLEKQGYLNDRSFAKSFINNKIITTNNGPYKIRRELSEHRVDSNIIEEEIIIFDGEIQLEKIKKISTRLYNSNRNKGGSVLKKKIVSDLVNLGYDTSIISKVINEFDFSNDKDIAKKEYEKLYKKLSRKYDGKELEYKIKEYSLNIKEKPPIGLIKSICREQVAIKDGKKKLYGNIKKIFVNSGYGFINSDISNENDVYFKVADIIGKKVLRNGQKVEYEITKDGKERKIAVKIKGVS